MLNTVSRHVNTGILNGLTTERRAMYTDGKLVTAGEKTRLHTDPFGVRIYAPEKCDPGYTLFSPAWGDQEYLIDMRGLAVHTWRVTHSNVAELLPNGNLFTQNCGNWLEELTPDSQTIWQRKTAPSHSRSVEGA